MRWICLAALLAAVGIDITFLGCFIVLGISPLPAITPTLLWEKPLTGREGEDEDDDEDEGDGINVA